MLVDLRSVGGAVVLCPWAHASSPNGPHLSSPDIMEPPLPVTDDWIHEFHGITINILEQ